MTLHPAEELGGSGDRADGRSGAGRRAIPRRRSGREDVADGGRREHRAGEMRAAALVLAGARLAVLVAADRDVLGAVVRGKLAAAEREDTRREREQAGDQLLR